MTGAQKNAVDNQRNVSKIETELFNKKSEYSDAVAGRVTAALSDTAPAATDSTPSPAADAAAAPKPKK